MHCKVCQMELPSDQDVCPNCHPSEQYASATELQSPEETQTLPHLSTDEPEGQAPLPLESYHTVPAAVLSEPIAAVSPLAYTDPTQYPLPSAQPPVRPTAKPLNVFLPLLIAIIIIGSLLLIENTGVIYYAAVAHPAEVNHTNAALGTISAQATTRAQELSSAQRQINLSNKQTNDAIAKLDAAPQTLYSSMTSIPAIINDPLQQNTYLWDIYQDRYGNACGFSNGAYHISTRQNNVFVPCQTPIIPSVGNFALQIQMNILSGDEGGIIFHADINNDRLYKLSFGVDGDYSLFTYVDNVGDHAKKVQSGHAYDFHSGAGQMNQIMLISQNNTFFIYANQQLVTEIHDTTYTNGYIALFAEEEKNTTEVAFSNLQLW
ncbi:hypothetical protein [Tengunoibacter tsumagoiensis]|uniref:3-keto-disaccharide hydrolase domain-containing protein n=1 Tax=Tengunoibacter tsumagoiensis TaxID=2014871 RepID=A0A402A493_9CHLR|nr:hypothetical protein [Tengunoibacter tsumagoiensis]GCE13940.1 hypothetical protein KTT_37990 [Tengunoibacter tsumagoiensis]